MWRGRSRATTPAGAGGGDGDRGVGEGRGKVWRRPYGWHGAEEAQRRRGRRWAEREETRARTARGSPAAFSPCAEATVSRANHHERRTGGERTGTRRCTKGTARRSRGGRPCCPDRWSSAATRASLVVKYHRQGRGRAEELRTRKQAEEHNPQINPV